MVDHREENVLGVDGSTVVLSLEFLSGVDTARDRTVGVKLGHHLIGTSKAVMVTNVVHLIRGDSSAAILTIITLRGRRPGAVTADISCFAHAVDEVICNILLARRVRNTGSVSISVDHGGITTIARATSLAVDDDLSIETDRG